MTFWDGFVWPWKEIWRIICIPELWGILTGCVTITIVMMVIVYLAAWLARRIIS